MSKSNRVPKSKPKSLPKKAKFAEDALVRQKNIIQGIMEYAGVMLAYLDSDFNFAAVSSAYAKGSGHTVEELIGKNHFDIFPNKENQALFERVRDTAEPITFIDKPFEFADQPERGVTYWDWALAPVMDENGRVQGLILSLFETTQRKRAEEEVRVLSRFPSENPNPVMRISKDGTILYCNDAGSPILDEWKSQIGQPVPSSWRQLVADVFISGTKKEFEEPYGSRTFSFVLAPLVEPGYLNVYGRDITERKKAEEEILRAKNEWERTFDSMPDLVAILDNKHQIVRANKAMAQRLGMNSDQCVGLNCFKCVHKLDGPPSFCPHSLTMADGKEHISELHEDNLGGDFLVSTTPLFDQQGQIVGSVHVARDITERKKAEEALRRAHEELELRVQERTKELREATEKLQTEIAERKRAEEAVKAERKRFFEVLEMLPAYLVLLTPDYRVSYANRFFRERFGEDRGGRCFEYLFGRTEPCEICETYKVLKNMSPHEWEWIGPDGRNYYIFDFPFTDSDGSTLIMEVGIDITERKRAEEALRKAHEELELRVQERTKELREATEKLQTEIAERKRAEEELRESQKDLNRAQAVAKTGSWRLDVRRNELLWSDETYMMFGIPKGTPLTYETFLNKVHSDDREYVDQKWQAAMRGEPYDVEHRIIVDGKVKWVRENAELEFDKDGLLLGGFGTAHEITERKRMEQELLDSLGKERQRTLEISALLGASRAILQHKRFEQAARSIFNSCKELLGAAAGYLALLSKDGKTNEVLFLDSGGLSCTVDPSLPMPIRGFRAEAYRTNKAVFHNDFLNTEWARIMPEGHVELPNVLFAPLAINEKTVGIIGLANKPSGFTEQDANLASAFGELASIALVNSRNLESLEENEKRLKEYSQHLEEIIEERTKRLQEAQRLATIGETASMVGHDIRNPLQSIEGAVYLAKEELESLLDSPEKKELKEIVEIIRSQTNYIDQIVADLQDFSRTPLPQLREADLQELITEALSMTELPGNIQVQTLTKDDLRTVTVDPVFIKRVLLNLIENAVHAMPNGGKLTIRVFEQDECINIYAEDTGVCIPEENKPKIFTPLFTTKAKGQGFGLAVCKKLVEALNGEITFESEAGKGTTFKIKLPQKKETV